MNTENYLDLISYKNTLRIRFYDLAEAVLGCSAANGTVVESMDYVFEIENAAGVQLDVLGELIGVPRLLDYLPATGDRVMDDDEYRTTILLTIAKNSWDGTIGSVKAAYDEAFGGRVQIVYVDNQDMTVTVSVYGGISVRELEIMENAGCLLIPAGVGKTVSVVGGTTTANLVTAVGISGIVHEEYVLAS